MLEVKLQNELSLLRCLHRINDVSSNPFDRLITRQIEQLSRKTGCEKRGSSYAGGAMNRNVPTRLSFAHCGIEGMTKPFNIWSAEIDDGKMDHR